MKNESCIGAKSVTRGLRTFASGSNFTSRETDATFVMAKEFDGKWHGGVVPFAVQVPYGMQVKRAVAIEKNSVEHEFVRELDGMQEIIYLASHDGINTLAGQQVAVAASDGMTLFDGHLRAATIETPLQSGELVLGEFLQAPYFVAADEQQTVVKAFCPVLSGVSYQRVRMLDTKADGNYRVLVSAIVEAYDALTAHPEQPEAVADELRTVLKQSEDMFSYRTHETDSDIIDQYDRLKAAIKAFLNGQADGIDEMKGQRVKQPAAFYSLSGLRVSAPRRGLYVSQGKKLVVR